MEAVALSVASGCGHECQSKAKQLASDLGTGVSFALWNAGERNHQVAL